jgi:hypothetical protein
MTDPPPQTPDGRIDQTNADSTTIDPTSMDQSLLDRSQQAARFLDLARQHAFEPEEPLELNPLIAARLHDAVAGFVSPAFDEGAEDHQAQDDDARDDADDFGDGNGFAAGMPFGLDDTPLDPFD